MTMTEQAVPPLETSPDWAGAPTHRPPVPEVEVLSAAGTTVVLRDPTTGDALEAELVYTMLSLRQLEARFGSLAGVTDALPKPPPPGEAAPEVGDNMGPVFTTISDALAPGLQHVRVTNPDTQQRVRLGKDPELCAEWLDPGRIQEYVQAFSGALSKAFGALMRPGPTAPGSGLTPHSPGPSGSTSAPSPSAAPPSSSGP